MSTTFWIEANCKAKYQQQLTPSITAVIYHYPDGISTSSKGFSSSSVAISGVNINDNRPLRVIWKLHGINIQKSQTCPIKKYGQFYPKSLGPHDLFKTDVLKKCRYIKIEIIISDHKNSSDEIKGNESNSSSDTINYNESNSSSDKIKVNETNSSSDTIKYNESNSSSDKMKGNETNSSTDKLGIDDSNSLNKMKYNEDNSLLNKLDINGLNNANKSSSDTLANDAKKTNKKRQLEIYDFMAKSLPKKQKLEKGVLYFLTESKMLYSIRTISYKLNLNKIFGLLPSINCSSKKSLNNSIFKKTIDVYDYFENKQCRDSKYWSSEVLWMEPPYHIYKNRQTMINIINSLSLRSIKGFVCVPYFTPGHYNYVTQKWLFDSMRNCIKYINIHGKYAKNYYLTEKNEDKYVTYETIILYYNYQD